MRMVEVDATYSFEVIDKTLPSYKLASGISEWLQTNLENLTDNNDDKIFSKVNTGFNKETLKTFGNKPVCDIYIDRVDYGSDYDIHAPTEVHTILLFYLKGANNHAYNKCCELHDYLIQEFITNDSFRRLPNLVTDTRITNSELMNQPLEKKWGVMGALELSHTLTYF